MRALILLLAAPLLAQSPTEITVRLSAPLTTQLNRAGDLVAARIIAPATYAGGYLEGDVKEIHGGLQSKGSSILFEFSVLHLSGRATPVGAIVTSVMNGKGQTGMDDAGATVEQEQASSGAEGLLSRIRARVPIGNAKDKAPAATPARLTARTNNIAYSTGTQMTVMLLSADK